MTTDIQAANPFLDVSVKLSLYAILLFIAWHAYKAFVLWQISRAKEGK